MHLPQSRVPGSEPDLFWIFLHSVFVVDVQFLTFSSSSAHLVRREAKWIERFKDLNVSLLPAAPFRSQHSGQSASSIIFCHTNPLTLAAPHSTPSISTIHSLLMLIVSLLILNGLQTLTLNTSSTPHMLG